MQVYTVHKKRVLVVAMAAGTLVLLLTMALISHPSKTGMDWTYTDESSAWWMLHHNFANSTDASNRLASSTPQVGHAGDIAPPNEDEDESMDNELDVNGAPAADSNTVYDKSQEGDYDEYESEDDEDNENSVFRDGDFDSLPLNASTAADVTSTEMDVMIVANKTNATLSHVPPSADSSKTPLSVLKRFSEVLQQRIISSFGLNNHVFDRRLQAESEPNVQSTSLQFESLHEPSLAKGAQVAKKVLVQQHGICIVENFIFWSKELERKSPKGYSNTDVKRIQDTLRQQEVTDISPPTWNRCGRPKNQYLTLSDGSHVCARYRAPHNYLVQGEVMSFYLGRLLALDNIPIVVLSKLNPQAKQWGRQSSMQPTPAMVAAGWKVNATVAFIQWIDGLERVKMPQILIDALRTRETISIATPMLKFASMEQLLELQQWSDLIVFDYITGNYDRVASMQDAADKEQKPGIMQDTVHNLVKSRITGRLWLIDNESGLLDAYSLMYAQHHPSQGKRFIDFQQQMLHTMCLFRQRTVSRLKSLHKHRPAFKLIINYISREEPLFSALPNATKNAEFLKHFQQRLSEVYQWILQCEKSATLKNVINL